MYCDGVSLVTSATATPHFEWEVPWEKPPVDESRGQGADGFVVVRIVISLMFRVKDLDRRCSLPWRDYLFFC